MLALIKQLTRRQKSMIVLSIDLLLLCIAAVIAFGMESLPGGSLSAFANYIPVLPYILFGATLLSVWMGLSSTQLVMYDSRSIGLTAIYAISLGALSATVSTIVGLDLNMNVHAVFGLVYFLLIAVSRAILLQVVQALYRRGEQRCRVLIYGAGTTGVQLVSAFQSNREIEAVAFVDDNAALRGLTVAGLQVYSPMKIGEIVKARKIDRVLLAMPSQSQPKQAQIARRLQKMGLDVQALPSFAQLIGQEELVDKLTPVPPQAFLGRETRDMNLGAASEKYKDRSVLVSGGGGSIGSELCRQILTCRPSRLVLFELSELALYNILMELQQPCDENGIELVAILGSVTDARQVRKVLEENQVQVVLHAAAYKHVPLVECNPLTGLANNVFGTQTLARESAQFGVERFILISSDKAVRPTNVMGATKRLAELLVQDLGTRNPDTVFTMVRFGNVLGSSGSVVPLFQDQVRRGGPVTVTDPRVVRYFMTLHEAVQLVLTAGAEAHGNEVFVLDMGKPVPIQQLARQVIESAGYSVRDDLNPDGDIEIKMVGLRPGEKLSEELSLSGDLLPTRHQKIFFTDENKLSEIEVASIMRGLKQALANNDEQAALAVVARWVEDYHPDASAVRIS
ncbi:nucleoside-diphosphate sugar epimerase/dehydratase [Aestuariivita sp.]|jgi:FlaA1/EpsC-like NDP-sugar epimerase|uniref:polysaccharide biosynthesis protein n=1 Tax=Aestuariivita sp. TaxID=1872407 RepID=UPI0021741DFB|nr:nucleoside-diphosphate sugar epimerase/dehydratase [Aestuariivita sp.]MCE8005552.1 polysaccharide biosynthesis protein [Aestuariivita sp.]